MKKRLIKLISPLKARSRYKSNLNFKYHINERFFWMKEFINEKKYIIEIGSGNGLSKKIWEKKKITTNILKKIGLILQLI